QARVAEDSLGLNQPLSRDTADQTVSVDIDITEREGSGVAQTNAVLVFRFVVVETLCAFFNDEPTRPDRSIGQDCVCAGNTAVADPLLVAVDLVAHDLAVFQDRVRRGAKGSQIAAA